VTKFELFGDKELDRALAELPKATARNTLNRVLKKAAAPVYERMQAAAPVLTGHLKLSVVVGPSSKLTSRQKRDARREGKNFAEIHVGTSDPAGMFEEFGTFKQPPHPWATPAWDATKEGALGTIRSELGTEIEKSAARLARKRAKAGG
jgi:HK97 gp10 family phage protein